MFSIARPRTSGGGPTGASTAPGASGFFAPSPAPLASPAEASPALPAPEAPARVGGASFGAVGALLSSEPQAAVEIFSVSAITIQVRCEAIGDARAARVPALGCADRAGFLRGIARRCVRRGRMRVIRARFDLISAR